MTCVRQGKALIHGIQLADWHNEDRDLVFSGNYSSTCQDLQAGRDNLIHLGGGKKGNRQMDECSGDRILQVLTRTYVPISRRCRVINQSIKQTDRRTEANSSIFMIDRPIGAWIWI